MYHSLLRSSPLACYWACVTLVCAATLALPRHWCAVTPAVAPDSPRAPAQAVCACRRALRRTRQAVHSARRWPVSTAGAPLCGARPCLTALTLPGAAVRAAQLVHSLLRGWAGLSRRGICCRCRLVLLTAGAGAVLSKGALAGVDADALFVQMLFQLHLARRLYERCAAALGKRQHPAQAPHDSLFVARYGAGSRMHLGGYVFGVPKNLARPAVHAESSANRPDLLCGGKPYVAGWRLVQAAINSGDACMSALRRGSCVCLGQFTPVALSPHPRQPTAWAAITRRGHAHTVTLALTPGQALFRTRFREATGSTSFLVPTTWQRLSSTPAWSSRQAVGQHLCVA